jgi:hypothetical protein
MNVIFLMERDEIELYQDFLKSQLILKNRMRIGIKSISLSMAHWMKLYCPNANA